MIGLVDYDLQSSNSLHLSPPNLEIMKLATYYQLEENTFCRLIDLNETELSSYDKIYFFSEKPYMPIIPNNFRQSSNIIFGGTGFTNGSYVPFENTLIDYTIPRVGIYKEFLKQRYSDGVKTKVIEHFLEDTYYRHYAGDDELPLPAIKRKKRIFLYDKNFFYPGWEKMIQRISSRAPSAIVTIHPIVCKTLGDYFGLRQFLKIARSNTVILDLDIPLADVPYMFKKYTTKFLEDIFITSNVYLPLGGNFQTNLQYYNNYIYIMNLLYSFWSHGIPIKIYYQYPHVGYNDGTAPLAQLTASWTTNMQNKKTLRERFTFKKKEQPPAYDNYQQIIKFYPSANDLFDQTYAQVKQRGFWRL